MRLAGGSGEHPFPCRFGDGDEIEPSAEVKVDESREAFSMRTGTSSNPEQTAAVNELDGKPLKHGQALKIGMLERYRTRRSVNHREQDRPAEKDRMA